MPTPNDSFQQLTDQTTDAILSPCCPSSASQYRHLHHLVKRTLAGYAAALETLFDAEHPLDMTTLPVFPLLRYEKPPPPAA